jgi:hypothetical protein
MKLLFALVPFLVFPAQAQDVPQVPTELFDIALGGTYEYSSDRAYAGTFPVKRLVSEQLSLHRGLSLYFEPLTESAAFPFFEIPQENGGYPIASYRLHVYPVIPAAPTTLADLRERKLPQRVFMIEWSRGQSETDRDGYDWAIDLCKSIEANLGMEPEVRDIVDSGTYRCVFSDGERELEVSSVLGRTIQLSFADEIEDQMDADVNSRIRRLEQEEAMRKRREATNH